MNHRAPHAQPPHDGAEAAPASQAKGAHPQAAGPLEARTAPPWLARPQRRALPWPLPALVVWALAWAGFVGLRLAGVGAVLAWALATALGVLGSVAVVGRVRKALVVVGFPLSWWLLAGGEGTALMRGFPAWLWLLPLGVLLLYPPQTWRDAPLYPTPPGALDGLAEALPLPLAGHVLDAGCGSGEGLVALERAYPEVHLHGIERSPALALLCLLRVRTAHVRWGDFEQADWSRFDLVYLFQRPETMARAWAKAQAELRPGAWLASLEFAVPGVEPTLRWTCPDGRTLWCYRKA